MMWTMADIIIALFMISLIGGILVLLVRAFYPPHVVVDEPYGDASDTPTTLQNARRANHARSK